jgi:DNA-binding transcriptional LysR family regulator
MELRHLRYFIAVAEELNYRRAAERLRVAHPALSRQIRDLEEELEVRLLERDRSGVSLTEAGSAYLMEARAIVLHAQKAVLAARQAAAGRRGRLEIGHIGAILASVMPASLLAFHERFPDVDVTLHEMDVPDQIAGLEAGTIQVAFTMKPAEEIPPHLKHLLVIRSPVGAFMSSRHRLAALARISPEDTRGEVILCLGAPNRPDGHAERVAAAFAARGIECGPLKRVNSFESLFALIAGHHGISFLPRLHGLRPADGIVVRPINGFGPDIRFELRAVWRRGEPSPLVRNFIEILRRANHPA